MRLRSVLSTCALSLLVLARTHAQTPQSTFQAEVNLIEVDAVVTDEQGNSVVGLTIDDFELFDDGQPQKIAAFSFVDIPLEIPQEFGVRSSAMEAAAKYYEDRLTLSIDPGPLKPEEIPQVAADMQDARMRTLSTSAKPTVDLTDFDRAQRVITVLDAVRALTDPLLPVPRNEVRGRPPMAASASSRSARRRRSRRRKQKVENSPRE
jgi:hypothetical protein